jgi:hypothetical protein
MCEILSLAENVAVSFSGLFSMEVVVVVVVVVVVAAG